MFIYFLKSVQIKWNDLAFNEEPGSEVSPVAVDRHPLGLCDEEVVVGHVMQVQAEEIWCANVRHELHLKELMYVKPVSEILKWYFTKQQKSEQMYSNSE